MKKNKAMFAVIGVSVIMLVLIGFLVFQTYSFASTVFVDDGYILTTVSENSPDDTVNAQHYFNKGEKFTKKYPEKVVFKDIDGEKVSIDTNNFLHYQSGSMSGLTRSVILDTDKLDEEQISYYSISNKSMLEATGKEYQVSNGGEIVSFSDFVWKISTNQYMVVSNEIKLNVAENEQKVFDKFVEVQYKDEGVVYLVNQEGTYSTVSSDAYLELENGIRIYLGSKNVSDGEVVLVNLVQMVIDSDDNIEIIPDEEYKNENLNTPAINIDVEDGEPGLDGEDGDPGQQGEAGQPGDPGEAGENGENGNNGNNGNNGTAGSPGAAGGAGAPGSPGNQGESADNSDVIYNPETMPQFDAVLDTTPYGVNAEINYSSNGCSVYGATVSIIEKSSGAEVWRKDVTDELAARFDIKCDTLKQNTEYALVISASYISPNSVTNEKITQDVYKKLFVTDNLGVKLEKKYATQEAIVLNLTKTDSNCLIEQVRVKYFDENLTLLGYGTPVGRQYDSIYFTFDVSEIAAGDSIPVEFVGLEHNSVYYMQLEVTSLTDNSDVKIIPTNSFPLQKFMTLKIPPEIGKPKVTMSAKTNSFVIGPSYVTDPDNGIMYYRYEIYEAGDIVLNDVSDTSDSEDNAVQGASLSYGEMMAISNTPPTAESIAEYDKYVNVSTNDDGDIVIEKKESTGNADDEADVSGGLSDDTNGTAEDSQAAGTYLISALSDEQQSNSAAEPDGETAYGEAGGSTTDAEDGESADAVSDDSGDTEWLSGIDEDEQSDILESFQMYGSERTAVLTSLAPLAKGSAAVSYTIKSSPVLTVEKETSASIELPIDGVKIKKNTDYVVRIVGVFYDNEGIIEYSSPLSDVFSVGDSVWPTIENELKDENLTASTAEGSLTVIDIDGTIDSEAGLIIKYSSNTPIEGSIREGEISVTYDMLQNGNTTGYYEIPYALKALKSEQTYTMSVIAGRMVVNESVYEDVVIGSKTFTTKSYSPLLMVGAEPSSSEIKGHSFVAKIALKPSDYAAEESLRTNSSGIAGLDNTGDMSAKSLTAIKFELYGSNEEGTGPAEEPFAYSSPAGLTGINLENGGTYSATQYAFNSSFYTDGYLKESNQNIDDVYDFSIVLTEENFGLSTDDLAEYESDTLYVKVIAAFDYTYGRGAGDRLYGDNNRITVGIQDDYSADERDKFVEVAVHPVVPKFPDEPFYAPDYEVTKYKAESNINNNADYYNKSNSNLSAGEVEQLSNLAWADLDDTTYVGVTVQGPSSLAKYSSSVIYYVYDDDGEEVANSGEIPVTNGGEYSQLPEWTFFLDAGDNQIHRGEKFTIETKVVLKNIKDETTGKGLIYPDDIDEYNDESNDENKYRIKDEFVLEKEKPSFRIIPWEGDTSQGAVDDIFYLAYKDVDKALEYDGTGYKAENIMFYIIEAEEKLSELQYSLSEVAQIGDQNVTGFYSLEAALDGDNALAVKYKLKEDAEYTEKKLISESGIIEKHDVSIKKDEIGVDVEVAKDDSDQKLSFKFDFEAQSKDDLGRIDIEFALGGDKISLTNLKPEIDDVVDEEEKYYRATVTVNYSDVYQLAGSSVIDYTLKLYYDDGKYGLNRALESSEGDAVPYYALQQNQSGTYQGNSGFNLKDAIYDRGTLDYIKDNTIKLNGYDNEITYSDKGMAYLPKSLSCEAVAGYVELPYVLPAVKPTIVTGYSVARVNAIFSGNNTLLVEENGINAYMRYRAKAAEGVVPDEWTEVTFDLIKNDLTAGGQKASLSLSDLVHNTEYEYEIYGIVISDGSKVDKLINSGTFRTINEITVYIAENDFVSFIADSLNRSKKTAEVNFQLKGVFEEDLKKVDYVSVEIMNSLNSSVVSYNVTQKELLTWFSAQSGSSQNGQLDLNCKASLEWEPSVEHVMDDQAVYTVKTTVVYSGSVQSNSATKSITPKPWDSSIPLFTVIGEASSNREHLAEGIIEDVYSALFKINGSDVNRVIAGKDDTTGTLYVQLLELSDSVYVSVENSLKELEVTFDSNGTMKLQTVSYENLKPNTSYRLMIYCNADYKNEGLRAATGTSEDKCNTVKYVDVTTPKSASANIYSMTLMPSESDGKVLISGVNLSNIEKIKYTLTDSDASNVWAEEISGDELGNYFKMNETSASNNQYVLYIPNLKNSNHNYQLTVEAYEKDYENGGTDYKMVAEADGVYMAPTSGTAVAAFSRLISALLG